MEPPRLKKYYPCGRQCIHIVRKTPWALCECNRFKLNNKQKENNKINYYVRSSFEDWCKFSIAREKLL